MATYYVNGSTGDDATTDATSDGGAYETIQGAYDDLAETSPEGGAAFQAGDIISIANGTYTELTNPTKPWIVKSTSGAATGVIITSSGNGKTVDLGSTSSGITFQDVTINYTNSKSSSRGAIICAGTPKVTLSRCTIGSTSYGVVFPGDLSVFDRCTFVHIPGQTATYNIGIYSSRSMTVTSCLFFNWLKYAIFANQGSNDQQTIQNCTVILQSGFNSSYGLYINGDGSGGPSVSNTLIYIAGSITYGIRVASAADVCVLKNNMVYNDGGTLTVTNEYLNTAGSTMVDNWSTDHSSETEADHTVDSGEDIFDNYAGGDYHPNSDGSASGNGIAALAPTYDYAGDEFASPPAIGAYATAASGWSGGSTVGPVAVGGVTSVAGVAIGSISEIIGV